MYGSQHTVVWDRSIIFLFSPPFTLFFHQYLGWRKKCLQIIRQILLAAFINLNIQTREMFFVFIFVYVYILCLSNIDRNKETQVDMSTVIWIQKFNTFCCIYHCLIPKSIYKLFMALIQRASGDLELQ